MEIKEAVEIVRQAWPQKGLRPEEYNAHKVIMDALCSSYSLCKVDEAIKNIEYMSFKRIEEDEFGYKEIFQSVNTSVAIDCIKEACL